MSVKMEYDLDSSSSGLIDPAKENSFEVEQDDQSTDIDIKFEYPYQSVQCSLGSQEDDDGHQEDNFVQIADPLEFKEHHSTNNIKNPNAYHRKPKQKEIHTCPYCDLTFPMKYNLRYHMIAHTKERPFSCPTCQESFPRKTTLTNHIKNVHQSSTTPTGRSQTRPKTQANQPCTCTTCGKIYPVPSQLATHMRLHSGEKPYPCKTCDKKFRTKLDLNRHIRYNHQKATLLSNPLKLFKCRVCGRKDFVFFQDFQQHRLSAHRNIPYDSEQEKSFCCGICGKPHFLREGAIICALLGHDPSRLWKLMFKVKCPECPDGELFRFHSVLALRRHWDKEHGDKQLPARFRQGMYDTGKGLKDELPSYTVDKKKSEDIRMNGPTILEQVGNEEPPLYVELDLFEIPEDERFYKRLKQKALENVEHVCTVCGLKLSRGQDLKRHLKVVHDPLKPGNHRSRAFCECIVCSKRFSKVGMLTKHYRVVHLSKVGERKRGRPKKRFRKGTKTIDGMVKAKNTEENGDGRRKRGRPRKKLVQVLETKINCNDNPLDNAKFSVNIREKSAVKTILNFQTVNVNLERIEINL